MRKVLILGLTVVLLSSCGGRMTRSQEGGDTLKLKYASLLTIVKHDGYTVAEIHNPWKPGKTPLTRACKVSVFSTPFSFR